MRTSAGGVRMMSPEQEIGLSGEIWTAKALGSMGYTVHMPPDFFAECHDLTVNDKLCVEVKLANQSRMKRQLKDGPAYYPRWQWSVETVTAKDCVLVLIAVDHAGIYHPFVMPSVVMAERVHFQINSHPKRYTGFISRFLGAWEVVEFMLNDNWAEKLDLTIKGLMSDDND